MKLQHLFQLYATTHYLKAAISAQLKMASDININIPWISVVDTIDALKGTITYEQSLKEKNALISNAKYKIDLDASIALSAKLIHQFTRISV